MLNFMLKNRYYSHFCLNNRDDFRVIKGVSTYPGILLIIFTFIFIFNSVVFAAPVSDRLFKNDNSDEPWNLTADEINHDRNTDIYTASGNVIIFKNSRKITADFVRFDHKTFHAHAKGNVKLTAGGDVLTGNSLDMDLKSETGTVHDGTIFLKENNFHISGKSIEKTGENSYVAEEATVSTCDGETPDWKITGKKITVDIEGYGFVNHAAFWTKKLPVMYVPFMVFPAKTKRQSGLLAPEIGQSDRKGIEYNQPYFWAINENTDATFYVHHMGERGEKGGFEYRYVLNKQTRGALMFDFLDDRKQDDGTNNSSEKWGYLGDSYLRPNSDRYWFRMKHDQELPDGFKAKVDLDFISDQDYLHEFKDGHNGFNATESYFKKYFGREIDNYDDPVRVNRLNLSKNWSSYSLNAETRWYDNVIKRRWSDTDDTLHKLPCYRVQCNKTKGVRHASLCRPRFRIYKFLQKRRCVRPPHRPLSENLYAVQVKKLSFTGTLSGVKAHNLVCRSVRKRYFSEDETIYNREMYDARLDLSTEFFRVFKINSERVDSIKHSIKPKIVYYYTPDEDQADYPNFDGIDRIGMSNLVAYSLINTFTSRSLSGKTGGDGGKDADEPSYAYNEFLRIMISQSFNINEEREDKKDGKPFSPLYGELKLTPLKYLSFSTDATWSTYDSQIVTRNVSGTLSDKRGDSLSAEYRFQRDSTESLLSAIRIKIFDNLLLRAYHEINIHDNKRIKTDLGFLYTAQCWSIDFLYTDEIDDEKFSFLINFTGLGGLGG